MIRQKIRSDLSSHGVLQAVDQYQRLSAAWHVLDSAAVRMPNLTWERFYWACNIISSRSFGMDALEGEALESSTGASNRLARQHSHRLLAGRVKIPHLRLEMLSAFSVCLPFMLETFFQTLLLLLL